VAARNGFVPAIGKDCACARPGEFGDLPMEKPHKRIMMVWIGEKAVHVLAGTMLIALAIFIYDTSFRHIQLVPDMPNELVLLVFLIVSNLILDLIFFLWATARYRNSSHEFRRETLDVQEGLIFPVKHSIPYERIDHTHEVKGGVTGILHKAFGVHTLNVVTTDKKAVPIQVYGVSDPSRFSRTAMDKSRLGPEEEERRRERKREENEHDHSDKREKEDESRRNQEDGERRDEEWDRHQSKEERRRKIEEIWKQKDKQDEEERGHSKDDTRRELEEEKKKKSKPEDNEGENRHGKEGSEDQKRKKAPDHHEGSDNGKRGSGEGTGRESRRSRTTSDETHERRTKDEAERGHSGSENNDYSHTREENGGFASEGYGRDGSSKEDRNAYELGFVAAGRDRQRKTVSEDATINGVDVNRDSQEASNEKDAGSSKAERSSVLRSIVENTLREMDEMEGAKCTKAKGSVDVCYPVEHRHEDEMLESMGAVQLATKSDETPKPQRHGVREKTIVKKDIHGLFSKEKTKKSIDDIIDK